MQRRKESHRKTKVTGRRKSQEDESHRKTKVTGRRNSQEDESYRKTKVTGRRKSQEDESHRKTKVTGRRKSQEDESHRKTKVTGRRKGLPKRLLFFSDQRWRDLSSHSHRLRFLVFSDSFSDDLRRSISASCFKPCLLTHSSSSRSILHLVLIDMLRFEVNEDCCCCCCGFSLNMMQQLGDAEDWCVETVSYMGLRQ
ncbi:unnamed protein product [Vicia faba]|uniref:Uncharacterized protein n=1 Tax=Vicia faba TaxID=3906 RepID=A0AAV1ACM7_VICFA|nr:unnamed protein product [Vicia faba]